MKKKMISLVICIILLVTINPVYGNNEEDPQQTNTEVNIDQTNIPIPYNSPENFFYRELQEQQNRAEKENENHCQDDSTKSFFEDELLNQEETNIHTQITSAKKTGDTTTIITLEEQIMHLRKQESTTSDFIDDQTVFEKEKKDSETNTSPLLRGSDILVIGTTLNEIRSSITSDTQGRLYVAVENAGTTETDIDIYRSTDNGQTWQYWKGVTSTTDCSKPSLAIGEGNHDYFFMTFMQGTTSIKIYRVNLNDPTETDFTTIETTTAGVSNPRIITDSSEFPGWYAYLVYNSNYTGKHWVVRFSRTITFGENWSTPSTVSPYCESLFYDGSTAYPDIDFGNEMLYVVYENYALGCQNTHRDIFLKKSSNYGVSWTAEQHITSDQDDEFHPSVAAVKNHASADNVVIAYTRDYDELDYDIWYVYSNDAGSTWSTYHCISCEEDDNEKTVDLTTSNNQGRFHTAYWHENDIKYRSATYNTPSSWTSSILINEQNKASSTYSRPSITINPEQTIDEEACITWTDYRNLASTGYDVYFDSRIQVNNPPYIPRNPSPANNSMNQPIVSTLSWTGGDPDSGDTVTYDIYFGTNPSPPLVIHNKTTATYNPGVLEYATTYYWKITSWDTHSAHTHGPRWMFTTQAQQTGKPDLIITDIWSEDETIFYQTRNIGNATATGGFETGLQVDGVFIITDYIQLPLPPGERYTSFFQGYPWTCDETTDILNVSADYGHHIQELDETNNYRQEAWKCDTTPPQIIAGPTTFNITQNSVEIRWTTNEPSDSTVYYGRKAGVIESNEYNIKILTLHKIILTELTPGITYHYAVESTDMSDNTVTSRQHYFTTRYPNDPVFPFISFFSTSHSPRQLPMMFYANATDNLGIDRVEFYMNDMLFDIAYSWPYQGFFDPAYLDMSDEQFYTDHTMSARAYDLWGNGYISQETMSFPEPCKEVNVELRYPIGGNAVLYTPDDVYHGYIDLGVYAQENYGLGVIFDDMNRPHSQERWGPVDTLEFYINDIKINETHPDDELVEYHWNAEGLDVGEYSYYAVAIDSSGCHHYTMEETLTVTQTRPKISLDQDISREDTYFHMEFYIRSTGQEDAYLDNMSIHLTGYQPVEKTTSDYTLQPNYDPLYKKCHTEITFDPAYILESGDLYTVEFDVVPIMYDGLDYNNIDINLRYHDSDGTDYYKNEESIESWEYLRDEAHEAFNESNYLIITNPTNLFSIYAGTDVDLLLSKTAELAILKHAVLGYFTTYASLATSFDSTDKVHTGNVRSDYHDEIVVLDDDKDHLAIYDAKARSATIKYENLSMFDQLAVGNVYPVDDYSGDPHEYDEILIADGTGDQESEITIYQLNLSKDWTFQRVGSFSTQYDIGDQLATGNITGSTDYEQIVLLNDEDGTIDIYDPFSSTPLYSYDTVFTSGDILLVGNIYFISDDEIIIIHVSSGFAYIYDQTGYRFMIELQDLSTDDSVTLGDVTDDSTMEILVADASDEEISIYGFNTTHLSLDSQGSFQNCDTLVCADLFNDAKDEIILARAHYDYHRFIGEMDIMSYDNFRSFDSRHALDELITSDGSWADNMNEDWLTDGYLLLVGEDEIIPSFSCEEDDKHIRQTDRYYASTDAGESGRHRELSTGRIIGDNPERLIKPIQTSIDIYNDDSNFDISDALAVAGYSTCYDGGCADIDFVGERNNVADELDTIGFDTIDELTSYASSKPSGMTDSAFMQQRRDLFFDHAEDVDLIHLAGHGNWDLLDLLYAYNVTMNFTAGDAHPLIYASSCLTGRYADGFGFAERFFDKNISSYIGATEVSYCCPNTDLANRFYDRVFAGRSLGTSLILAINSHASGGPWYERDIRRYNSAIYHFFGDPTLTYRSLDKSATKEDSDIQQTGSKGEQITINLPMYTVLTENTTDYVTIPDGGLVVTPGMPLVPSYTTLLEYPAGFQIQSVELKNRSGLITETGLNLSTGVWAEAGTTTFKSDKDADEDAMFWPEDIYTWEVVHSSEEKTILSLTIYPFYYNSLTTESQYYQHYEFEINGSDAQVIITDTTTDKVVYEPLEIVDLNVYLQNLQPFPTDVIIDAQIASENNDQVVDGMPLRVLNNLTRFGSVRFHWNSTGFEPGNYYYQITLSNLNGTIYDTANHLFTLGITSVVISEFTATPDYFEIGDDIHINVEFTSIGTQTLDGRAVISIVSPEDVLLETYTYNITSLDPTQTITITQLFDTTGLSEGDYQISCYVIYDGQSSDILSLTITTREPEEDNQQPLLDDEHPFDTMSQVNRPPNNLEVTVEDLDDDTVDVYIRWKNHANSWTTLATNTDVSYGIYSYSPIGNDWIWGNTTYTWSVNVTDGLSWTNKTYTYTTRGSRYDVNNNNIVNFQDAGLVWTHRSSLVSYDALYDVNGNGQVNFQDAGLTWVNRD